MADEFMRFLVRTEELNNLAKIKRLITVSKDYSLQQVMIGKMTVKQAADNYGSFK